MARKNTVGDDISTPMRIPLSMQDSVSSLVKLHRGRASCPQLYASVAMYTIYKLFDAALDSLPNWDAESDEIKRYISSLITGLITLHERDLGNESLSTHIDSMESVLEKIEYSISELSLYRVLYEKLDFIENTEKLLKKEKVAPFFIKRDRRKRSLPAEF